MEKFAVLKLTNGKICCLGVPPLSPSPSLLNSYPVLPTSASHTDLRRGQRPCYYRDSRLYLTGIIGGKGVHSQISIERKAGPQTHNELPPSSVKIQITTNKNTKKEERYNHKYVTSIYTIFYNRTYSDR